MTVAPRSTDPQKCARACVRACGQGEEQAAASSLNGVCSTLFLTMRSRVFSPHGDPDLGCHSETDPHSHCDGNDEVLLDGAVAALPIRR